jgi:hypothetical protein
LSPFHGVTSSAVDWKVMVVENEFVCGNAFSHRGTSGYSVLLSLPITCANDEDALCQGRQETIP